MNSGSYKTFSSFHFNTCVSLSC